MRRVFRSHVVSCLSSVAVAVVVASSMGVSPVRCEAAQPVSKGKPLLTRPFVAVARDDDEEPPPVVGEFIVRGTATVSGTATYQASDATGSVDQRESLNATITGMARYGVEWIGGNLVSGEPTGGSSAVTVEGGGSLVAKMKGGTLSGSWQFGPSPNFDPTQPGAVGTLDTGSDYCGGVLSYPPIESTGDSQWGAARDAAYEAFRDANTFEFEIPPGTNGWTLTQSRSGTYQRQFVGGSAEGSAQCTMTVTFVPAGLPQWEAILEPVTADRSEYSRWLPKGGATEDEPGAYLGARVYLRAKDGSDATPPDAKFTFQLRDVSREPGICMNFPPRSKPACAETTPAPFDLRIVESDEWTVTEEGQRAETREPGREAGIAFACYDDGAYGKLVAVAETVTGLTLVARVENPDGGFLSIPVDENQNHVGDEWERAQRILERALPANWERALDGVYAGQADAADGLTLYEKYRGFHLLREDGQSVHERLDPWRKCLFVHEPSGLLRAIFRSGDGYAVSYPLLSQVSLCYIGPQGWTGPGVHGEQKRIVNFNCSGPTHAVDQHAIDVHFEMSKTPTRAALNELRQRFGLPANPGPVSATEEGCTYLDESGPAAFQEHWRPSTTLQVDIFAAGVADYLLRCVAYHVRGECAACDTDAKRMEFARTYLDPASLAFRRKSTIELSATCAHELGHATGANHHEPGDSDPANPAFASCTMRYYEPDEYPVDPGDPFELASRGLRPNRFCTTGFNCWGQLGVSDKPGAGAWAAAGPGSVGRQAAAVLGGPPPAAAGASGAGAPSALLGMGVGVVWSEVVEGDPLRLSLCLRGPTDQVAAGWTDGVRIGLYRLGNAGARDLVLGADAWRNLTLPAAFDTRILSVPDVPLVREWLAPPALAALVAGEYVLEVSWDGRGRAPAATLPPTGVVAAAPVSFRVVAADGPRGQAVRERHLAWARYLVDDDAGALEHARAAVLLDPRFEDPLSIRSQLLLADVAVRLGQPAVAVQALDGLRQQLPPGGSHAAEEAWERHALLAPRIHVLEAPAASRPVRLEVEGFPGQTYVVEVTSDLRRWTAVATNTPGGARFEVRHEAEMTGRGRFYRVVWLP